MNRQLLTYQVRWALDTLMARFGYYRHYVSTYCIDGLHHKCRRSCKNCPEVCQCPNRDCSCRESLELGIANRTNPKPGEAGA